MIYKFMRLLVFFDLPMVSKKEVRIYNQFHKWLIKNGYIMMQYSIYIKSFNNRDSCVNHISQLKKSVPDRGQIRIMMITEKQYSNMEIIVGGKSINEDMNSPESLIIL